MPGLSENRDIGYAQFVCLPHIAASLIFQLVIVNETPSHSGHGDASRTMELLDAMLADVGHPIYGKVTAGRNSVCPDSHMLSRCPCQLDGARWYPSMCRRENNLTVAAVVRLLALSSYTHPIFPIMTWYSFWLPLNSNSFRSWSGRGQPTTSKENTGMHCSEKIRGTDVSRI